MLLAIQSGRALMAQAAATSISSHRVCTHTRVSTQMRVCALRVQQVPSIRCLSSSVRTSAHRGIMHTEEDAAYWATVLSKVKPGLMAEMGELLDPKVMTGLDPAVIRSKRLPKPLMHDFVIDLKREFPQCIVLSRCGTFYELIGIDAMVGVDVLGINWKSPGKKVPAAGIHQSNLGDQLPEINAKGFSVVVAEELEDKPGKTSNSKERAVAFVSTPASPVYLESQTGRRTGLSPLPPPPKLGIAYGKMGCTLMALRQEANTVTVMEGLTLDGLLCQINALGVAPPILVHSSFDEPEGKKLLSTLMKRIDKEFSATQSAPLKASFAGTNPLQAFMNEVRVSIYKNNPVDIKSESVPKGDRPRPPYLSTVMQLGLSPHALGAPSLLDAALSLQAPATCRNWMRVLLLTPPPYKQAANLRSAVDAILESQHGKFKLELGLQSDMIMRKLRTTTTDFPKFFAQLTGMMRAIGDYLNSEGHKPIVDPVLAYTFWESQLGMYEHSRIMECPDALRTYLHDTHEDITAVVDVGLSDVAPEEELPTEEEKPKSNKFVEPEHRAEVLAKNAASLRSVRAKYEASFYFIKDIQMPEELEAVKRTYERFERQITGLFDLLYACWLETRPKSKGGSPEIAYSTTWFMAYAKVPRNTQTAMTTRGLLRDLDLHKAMSPGGEDTLSTESLATKELEEAQFMYLTACKAAAKRGAVIMQQLCSRLSEGATLSSLLLSARMSIVLEALFQHVQHVHNQGWCLPEVLPPPSDPSSSSSTPTTIATTQSPANSRSVSPASSEGNDGSSGNSSSQGSKASSTARAGSNENGAVVRRRRKGSRSVSPGIEGSNSPASSPPSSASPPPPSSSSSALPAAAAAAAAAEGGSGSALQGAATATATHHPTSMELIGLRPYYLSLTDAAVPNNIHMHGNVWLLTGANMAGKSTIMRSVAAASLLGMCGLMVPATSARIPSFDAVMLRNSSGDSAMEGKSSFKMETDDVNTVLQESTSQSLVLMDELGKGTEVDAGTAIAAEVGAEMAARNCTTIIATHLHDLVDELSDLEAQGKVDFMRMGLAARPGAKSNSSSSSSSLGNVRAFDLIPTWKLEKGVCKESLALVVLRDSGVPSNFLARADARYEKLRAKRLQLESLESLAQSPGGLSALQQNAHPHSNASEGSSSSNGSGNSGRVSFGGSGGGSVDFGGGSVNGQQHSYGVGSGYENGRGGSYSSRNGRSLMENVVGSVGSSTSSMDSGSDGDVELGSSSMEDEGDEGDGGVQGWESEGGSKGSLAGAPAAMMAPPRVNPKAVSKAQFDDAVEILSSTAQRVHEMISEASEASKPPSQVYFLSPTQEVPPLHASGGDSGSAVYLCHYPRGEVYCGQSKSLQVRLRDHRKGSHMVTNEQGQRKRVPHPFKGPDTSMAYVIVDPTIRGRVESATIKALQAAGIPLTSASDAENRNF